ncbi:MAG: DNA polymerase III subunit delta [Myxococcota bacterium]
MATRRGPRAKKAVDPFAELEKKGPQPVYAIDGEERVLVESFLARLLDVALPPGARDFNYESFTGKEADLSRVLDAAMTLPAFAERRVIRVQQADKMKMEPVEVLLRYLEKPSESTVLIFVAEKFDARAKVYKAFQKAGAALRFPRPKPQQMPDLIQAQARTRCIRIESSAARLLAETVGADLTGAVQALEKLELYKGVGAAEPIGRVDVSELVANVKEESVFDLVDAIGTRDRAKAIELLHRLMNAQREPGLRLLAMVARHVRLLLRAQAHLASRGEPRELPSVLGLPPFLADKLARQARSFGRAQLVVGHARIKRADRLLKSSRLSDLRVMERLALELMR